MSGLASQRNPRVITSAGRAVRSPGTSTPVTARSIADPRQRCTASLLLGESGGITGALALAHLFGYFAAARLPTVGARWFDPGSALNLDKWPTIRLGLGWDRVSVPFTSWDGDTNVANDVPLQGLSSEATLGFSWLQIRLRMGFRFGDIPEGGSHFGGLFQMKIVLQPFNHGLFSPYVGWGGQLYLGGDDLNIPANSGSMWFAGNTFYFNDFSRRQGPMLKRLPATPYIDVGWNNGGFQTTIGIAYHAGRYLGSRLRCGGAGASAGVDVCIKAEQAPTYVVPATVVPATVSGVSATGRATLMISELTMPNAPVVGQLIETNLLAPAASTGYPLQVFGTGIYTADSDLGTAAVHAGVLAPGQSGRVRIRVVAGQPSYQGSSRNGVTTLDWNQSWGLSFSFE